MPLQPRMAQPFSCGDDCKETAALVALMAFDRSLLQGLLDPYCSVITAPKALYEYSVAPRLRGVSGSTQHGTPSVTNIHTQQGRAIGKVIG
jgi:hypothetical protein